MTYYDLLAQAQRDPAGADFHSLRMAYAQSPEYAPYDQDVEGVEMLSHALQANDLDTARTAIDRLLDLNYLDIEAHLAAAHVALKQGDADKGTYHGQFARGLIDAIIATGSGQHFADAYIVINVWEERVVLRLLGLKLQEQVLAQHDGQWFDLITAQQTASGQTVNVYFNVDLPRRWLEAHTGTA